jgi:hypothetical protein
MKCSCLCAQSAEQELHIRGCRALQGNEKGEENSDCGQMPSRFAMLDGLAQESTERFA